MADDDKDFDAGFEIGALVGKWLDEKTLETLRPIAERAFAPPGSLSQEDIGVVDAVIREHLPAVHAAFFGDDDRWPNVFGGLLAGMVESDADNDDPRTTHHIEHPSGAN